MCMLRGVKTRKASLDSIPILRERQMRGVGHGEHLGLSPRRQLGGLWENHLRTGVILLGVSPTTLCLIMSFSVIWLLDC